MSTPVATTFDEVQAVVADVEGWMTPAQAKRLWTCGRTVRPGRKGYSRQILRGIGDLRDAGRRALGNTNTLPRLRSFKFSNSASA